MRVVVSAPTRFHLFDLARELLQKGLLQHLFTAYPQRRVDDRLRPFATGLPVHGVLGYLARRLGHGVAHRELEWQFITRYDRAVARRLPKTDIVVGLSGRTLHTLRRAKQLGALAVCDRGSSHISHQEAVLAEEHAIWEVPYTSVDSRGLAKELMEYDEADLITVPSRFARATFEAHGVPASKIAVVPYGVDLDAFHPGKDDDDLFRVLFVGSVSLRKGVPYLLEAVRPLGSLRDFHVLLAGRSDREALRWLSRFNGNYRLLGQLNRSALANIYANSSVFVLPSVEEGLALVIAQAMASSLPVIATPESGAEDLLTDGVEGFIVPSRSPEAIRERLVQLYNDASLRSRMGQAAHQRVRQRGGWAEYGRKAIDAYVSLR